MTTTTVAPSVITRRDHSVGKSKTVSAAMAAKLARAAKLLAEVHEEMQAAEMGEEDYRVREDISKSFYATREAAQSAAAYRQQRAFTVEAYNSRGDLVGSYITTTRGNTDLSEASVIDHFQRYANLPTSDDFYLAASEVSTLVITRRR